MQILWSQTEVLWLCLAILLFTICTLRLYVQVNFIGAASVEEIAVSLLKAWKPLILGKSVLREPEIQCWNGTFHFWGNVRFGSGGLRFSLQNSE